MYIYELRPLASHRQIEVAAERMINLAHKKALKQLDVILLLFQHSGQHQVTTGLLASCFEMDLYVT
jgi:hypothetical protein